MPRPKSPIQTKPISVRLPVPMVEWVEAQAKARGLTMTELIHRLIERAGYNQQTRK